MNEDPEHIQNRAPYAHLAGPVIQKLALTLLAPALAALIPVTLFGALSGDWTLDPAGLHSPAAMGVFHTTELAIGIGILFGLLAEDGLGLLPPCLISAGICLAGVSAYGGPAWTLESMCALALIAAIGLVRAVFAALPRPPGEARRGGPATIVHPWLWALCAPLFVWGVLHGFPNAIGDLSILFLSALYLIARTVQPVNLVQPRELSLMPFFSPSETVARYDLLRGIRPQPQRKARAKPARPPRIDAPQSGAPVQGPAQKPVDERQIQPFRSIPAADQPAALPAADSPVAPRPPRSNFSRVVGMDELKKQLREAADDIRSGWDASGGGMERKNGILLHGEPGNGKSFIAEALAGELGLVFFKLTLGDVSSRWINQTTEQLQAVFRQARETPNSMLFIDEIDALLPDRNATGGGGYLENRNLVNSFLLQAEEIRYTQTILVGATNYIDHLDPAAIREGRFDYKIMIPPPDLAARRALIGRTAAYAGRPVTLPSDDLDLLLDATEGLSATRLLALSREVGDQIRKGRIVGTPVSPPPPEGAAGALIRFSCPSEQTNPSLAGGAAGGAAASTTQPKTVATTYRDFSNALNQIRGQMGLVLPENTPTLSGVMLADNLRASLESVVWRMTHAREAFSRGGTLPTGMVFYGPPGTGKTLAARAIAKECEWNFLPVSGSEIVRGQGGVAGFISRVRAARPVIAFIDEADDILARRDAYGNPALNELLQALDGSSGHIKNALFIAATNRIEAIDPAALRGGRFAEKFLFDLPDARLMEQFARHWMGRSRARFGVGIPEIIAVLEGLSYASAESVLQNAANRAAVRPDGLPVGLDDLVRARKEV